MSFRQPKSDQDRQKRAWQAWLSGNQAALRAIGLPPSITLSEEHWIDFLQNGYLERHPESWDGFEFGQLTREQMAQLLAVLEASPEYSNEPLMRWVQVRLERV